jgi:hypothetical protein
MPFCGYENLIGWNRPLTSHKEAQNTQNLYGWGLLFTPVGVFLHLSRFAIASFSAGFSVPECWNNGAKWQRSNL